MELWDAENRLISIIPVSPATDDKKVEFSYDYMSRRVRKTASTYNGSAWVEDNGGDWLFVYDDWNVVMVLDANDSNAILRKAVPACPGTVQYVHGRPADRRGHRPRRHAIGRPNPGEPAMPTLSAFADEISPDPQVQMDTLEANGIRHIELRGAWDTNVMKFSKEQRTELKQRLFDRGFGVACIASPIGKVKIDDDYRQHFDDFRHAVDLAEFFDSHYIRIFSYYPPDGEDIADYRSTVLDRLAEKLDYIADHSITLVLENESHLFGEYPERCVYLHAALPSDQLTAAFDPANFVNMNVKDVYNTCWLPMRQCVGYFHIKDFKYGETEHAVPAGTGDGEIPEILRDARADGYDGFLALEPHLAKAEHSTGQTGPDLFNTAADALKKILANIGWTTD